MSDDQAILAAIEEVEAEIDEEEFRENPSIWDMSATSSSANVAPESKKNLSPDEIAIEKAIAEVENELEEEQFRENPSIWDLNLDVPDKGGEKSIWEMNLKEIDEDLKEIQSKRISNTAGGDTATPSPEDDVAIADAIAQVEKELQKEKNSENSIWYLGLVIAGGLIASKIAQSWFNKSS